MKELGSEGVGSVIFSKETAKEAAIVGGIVLAMGGVAYQHRHDNEGQSRPAPVEKSGDHNGVTHNSEPGSGVMHTKNGDFHVTQK